MVPIIQLLIPIGVAAIVVWVATAFVWIALPFHKSDYRGFPNEDAVREAIRQQDLAPGMYDIPLPVSSPYSGLLQR